MNDIRDENRNITIGTSTTNNWKSFELILNIIQFALVSCYINVTFQFMGLYMISRYNLSLFWISTQIIAGSIAFVVVSVIMPNYIQTLSLKRKYLLATPFYFILVIIYMFSVPMTNKSMIYLIWIWWFVQGGVVSMLFVIEEICIIELQPKLHTGKVNGLKTALRFGISCILSSLVAYFWNTGSEHIWFCYFQAIAYIIAFFINLCLILIKIVVS
eukprot:UN05904